MNIEIITELNRFEELKPAWNALLEQNPAASFFQTWEWLHAWWVHFGNAKKLFIMTVRDEAGRLAGIAPFCLQIVRWFHVIPLKKIKFLGTEKVSSDFLDFILAPGLEEPALRAILDYLSRHRREWDVIEMAEMEECSKNVAVLRTYLLGRRGRVFEKLSAVCPYIPLPREYSQLCGTLSVNMRKNLRRCLNHAEEEHLAFGVEPGGENIRQSVDEVFRLHYHRFDAKTNFQGERLKQFHYDVASGAAAQKWLRLYFLKKEDEIIGCIYAFAFHGKLYGYQGGFHPAWNRLGIGHVMDCLAIQDSIRAHFSEYHFLRGVEAYKTRWTRHAKRLLKVTWVNPNLKGSLYAGSLRQKMGLKKLLKRMGLQTPGGLEKASSSALH
jgi:CelD/BcsL family acetyltransferase involved in cellulose biosynthesis